MEAGLREVMVTEDVTTLLVRFRGAVREERQRLGSQILQVSLRRERPSDRTEHIRLLRTLLDALQLVVPAGERVRISYDGQGHTVTRADIELCLEYLRGLDFSGCLGARGDTDERLADGIGIYCGLVGAIPNSTWDWFHDCLVGVYYAAQARDATLVDEARLLSTRLRLLMDQGGAPGAFVVRYSLGQDKLVLLYALDKLSDTDLQDLIDVPYADIGTAQAARERAKGYLSRIDDLTPGDLASISAGVPEARPQIKREAGKAIYEVEFVLPADKPSADPWNYAFVELLAEVCGYEQCGKLFLPKKRGYPSYCSTEHYFSGREDLPGRKAAERERLRKVMQKRRGTTPRG